MPLIYKNYTSCNTKSKLIIIIHDQVAQPQTEETAPVSTGGAAVEEANTDETHVHRPQKRFRLSEGTPVREVGFVPIPNSFSLHLTFYEFNATIYSQHFIT